MAVNNQARKISDKCSETAKVSYSFVCRKCFRKFSISANRKQWMMYLTDLATVDEIFTDLDESDRDVLKFHACPECIEKARK